MTNSSSILTDRFLSLKRFAMLRRATLSCAATLLVTLFVVVFTAFERELDDLSEQVVLTVFFEADADMDMIKEAQRSIAKLRGIDSTHLRSAGEIKETFASRYATNIGSLLPENAFPNALILTLKKSWRSKERVDSLVGDILVFEQVGNISYRPAFVEALDARRGQLKAALWICGFVVAFIVGALAWQSPRQVIVYQQFEGVATDALTLRETALGAIVGVLWAIAALAPLYGFGKASFPFLETLGGRGFLQLALVGAALSLSASALALGFALALALFARRRESPSKQVFQEASRD
jgi:cell division protein FtsX